MENLEQYLGSFYVPTYCGKLGSSGNSLNVACFGWLCNRSRYLVAVSAYGNYSAIQSMYDNLNSGQRLTLTKPDGISQDGYSDGAFRYLKIPPKGAQIPGTEIVSATIVHKAMLNYFKESNFIYLPNTNDEDDTASRLLIMLRKMTPYPIMESWAKPLMQKAIETKHMQLMKDNIGDGYYYSDLYGFSAWLVANTPEQWEKIITDCLKEKRITIEVEEVMTEIKPQKKEGVIEVPAVQKPAYENIEPPEDRPGTGRNSQVDIRPAEFSAEFPIFDTEGDGYKVSREFWFRHNETGQLICMWDYKQTSMYSSEYPSPDEVWASMEIMEMSIGAVIPGEDESSWSDAEWMSRSKESKTLKELRATDFAVWLREHFNGKK